jgi:hypothetical protein
VSKLGEPSDGFVDVDDAMREKMIQAGLVDVGGGKSRMEIDDETVEACRDSREFCAAVIRKARAVAQNVKDNGADFETTWAGLIALNQVVDSISRGSYPMLAYLLTEEVFGGHCASCDGHACDG